MDVVTKTSEQVSSVNLVNRKKLEITGVKKIENLNSEEFIIDTNLGILKVEGTNLEMKKLELEKGNLQICGNINSMNYENKEHKGKKKQSFLSKLFK